MMIEKLHGWLGTKYDPQWKWVRRKSKMKANLMQL